MRRLFPLALLLVGCAREPKLPPCPTDIPMLVEENEISEFARFPRVAFWGVEKPVLLIRGERYFNSTVKLEVRSADTGEFIGASPPRQIGQNEMAWLKPGGLQPGRYHLILYRNDEPDTYFTFFMRAESWDSPARKKAQERFRAVVDAKAP